MLALFEKHYPDYGPTLASEKLSERHLRVEVIHAHSPAAKGRIERLFQTLQDRLVKELGLAGASTQAGGQPGSRTLPRKRHPE